MKKGSEIDFGIPLKNPIPDTIVNSGKVLQLKLITQVPATGKEKPIARTNKILAVPGSKRIFINDLNGVLYELKKGEVQSVLEITDHYENFINKRVRGRVWEVLLFIQCI